MHEWPHDPHNVRELFLELGLQDLLVREPAVSLIVSPDSSSASFAYRNPPVDHDERATLQQVDIPIAPSAKCARRPCPEESILMCLVDTFRRNLQFVLHSEDVLPFALGMWLRGSKQRLEVRRGDDLAQSARGSLDVIPTERVRES